jgi:hypothetical protein
MGASAASTRQNKLFTSTNTLLEVQIPESYLHARPQMKAQVFQQKPLHSDVPCFLSVNFIAVKLDSKMSDISTLLAPGEMYAIDYPARFAGVAQQRQTLLDSHCS